MSLTLIGKFDVYTPTFHASGTDPLEILPIMCYYHGSNSALIPYLTEPQRGVPVSSIRIVFVLLHLLPGPIGSKGHVHVHGRGESWLSTLVLAAFHSKGICRRMILLRLDNTKGRYEDYGRITT